MSQKLHLGIYLGHDTGIAVVDDHGVPLYIAEESKFCGYKSPQFHCTNAIESLAECGYTQFESLSWAFMDRCPDGAYWERYFRFLEAIRPGLKFYLNRNHSWEKEFFHDHHISHGAGAFLASPFNQAIVIVADGSGEDESLTVYLADKKADPILHKVEMLKTNQFSFGHTYDIVTRAIGYEHGYAADHSGKIMGLSSYGSPRYAAMFRKLFRGEKGSPYPSEPSEPKNLHSTFTSLIGSDRLPLHEGFSNKQADLAASLQRFVEDEFLSLVARLKAEYPSYQNLCFSGGVAQNSLMTGKILAQEIFEEVFVLPISGDTGLAYGAAVLSAANNAKTKQYSFNSTWNTAYHGYKHKDLNSEISQLKQRYNIDVEIEQDVFDPKKIAKLLLDGQIIALFQDAQEVGPRALGNRSILTLPTSEMRDQVNNRIKFREAWRPFAPVLLENALEDIFCTNRPEPFMSTIYDTPQKNWDKIAGVNHFDNTSRLQTVSEKQNPRLCAILTSLQEMGHLPLVLNTSFNVDGQTIVRTAWDAICTLFVSGLDCLIMEDTILKRRGDKRWERDCLSPADRLLERRLRNISKLKVLSLCNETEEILFIQKLNNSPSVSSRRDLIVEKSANAKLTEIIRESDQGAFLLIYLGSLNWIETVMYVATEWKQKGYLPTLFDQYPELMNLVESKWVDKTLLLDASGVSMPLRYYKDLIVNREVT